MRRRSDRGKTKQPEPTQEESSEKSCKKSHRHSRRRKKSSSSSEDVADKSEVVQDIPQPLEMQVKDIELPQGEQSQPTNASDKTATSGEEPKGEWKEDNAFWETEGAKSTQETEEGSKEKEESSLWKVQSANGGGGEIQKLKICRQRPTESPEIGESSLHKRLSRGNKDGRSTDDSTHDESERDTKKSKHKTRSSSRNSPLVSPTVVCDLSEDSPTKIKIINVGNINSENKTGSASKPDCVGDVKDDTQPQKAIEIQEDSQMSDTLDIALPVDEPPTTKQPEVTEEKNVTLVSDNVVSNKNIQSADDSEDLCKTVSEVSDPIKDDIKQTSTSASPSPKIETLKSHTSRSSSDDSDSSQDESKPRKVKKKRRRELQSMVQRKKSSSASPKRESPDSEDDGMKKDEAAQRESTEAEENTGVTTDKDSEMETSLTSTKENKPEETNGDDCFEQRRMPRKRRWGSSTKFKCNETKLTVNISTDSLKKLIPDAKPIPPEELQLSMEEEEGQLDDDDEDDEVVAMVTKEEEKQLEQEREKYEKQNEKEVEDKRRRQERFEKSKHEHSSPEPAKVEIPRKIHLITDDAKKLARSPSPPRRKPTSVLYITHLVRPFTVQQLKNLLLRTGQIAENGFWIDKIKSKCYVQYTTEDAAVETRHALHGVRWPTSNPKTLLVEFAAHDDMVMAQTLSEEPEVPRKAEPLNMVEGWVADQARIKERTRRTVVREWDVGKPEHPDEILEHELKMKEKKELERRARKERPHRSTTPEVEPPNRKARRKEEDAPAKLLDDLFRKTKVSPCIYWLPLTQEQISVKEEIRRQHMAEHERRMAELKKVELARRDREKRSRK